MDVAKVAKDYFLSSQSSLLIPNREYGSRKIINIGPVRSAGAGSVNLNTSSSAATPQEQEVRVVQRSPLRPASLVLKGLLAVGPGVSVGRGVTLRQKSLAMRSGNKQWQHPPETLVSGHILYSVKFLGECSVDQPKGTEVVKDAIRKMKFSKHIKRAEGQKPPKVELIISVDAVTILDPKTRLILHQYPLHRISYCADDKSDKRMFTFIAKEANGSQHFCYVFDSEKCAEEITLTIGQAFDLAYKKFMETSASDGDIRKQFLLLQKMVHTLQFENDSLRKRVAELEKLKDKSEVEAYKKNNQITDLQTVTLNLHESSTDDGHSPRSPSDSQSLRQSSVVGRRLENLILNDGSSRSGRQSNGTHATTSSTPILSPPPVNSRSNRSNSRTGSSGSSTPNTPSTGSNTFFGSPVTSSSQSNIDQFGMEVFNPVSPTSEQELIDIQAGFSRGLSFGTDDFNLDDLDPLNQK